MPFARRCWVWVAVAALAALAPPGAAWGQTVVDAARGFTFDIPPGLTRSAVPDVPGVLYGFAGIDPRLGGPDVALAISQSPVAVSRGQPVPLPSDAPPGATLATRPWQGTGVTVMFANTYLDGRPMAARVALVPLASGAVRIALLVRPGHHPSADEVLAVALKGMRPIGTDPDAPAADGGPAVDPEKLGEAVGGSLVVLACLGGAAWKVLRR